MGLWRRLRGTRAGCRRSWRPASDGICGRPIPKYIGQRSICEVYVLAGTPAERIRRLRCFDADDFRMPVFFVTNVCHLFNRMGLIDVRLRQFRLGVVCFTETLLNCNVSDSVISFSGYNFVRRDMFR